MSSGQVNYVLLGGGGPGRGGGAPAGARSSGGGFAGGRGFGGPPGGGGNQAGNANRSAIEQWVTAHDMEIPSSDYGGSGTGTLCYVG